MRLSDKDRKRVNRQYDKWRNGSSVQAVLAQLLQAERRRVRVRALVRKEVLKRSEEYMRDAHDPKQKTMAAINAGRAWAFKDFCDDLLAALKEGK